MDGIKVERGGKEYMDGIKVERGERNIWMESR